MQVLVVDDDATSRTIVATALEKLGHQCRVARNGAEAWTLLEQHPADVVFTDWMMPELDGPTLTRRLRADPDRPYTYVILVTASEQTANAMAAVEAGADDFLTKPIDFNELEVRLVNARRVTDLHRRLAEQRAELERLNAEVQETARTDRLTGIGNRLRLEEDAAAFEARYHRYQHGYAIALLDLDHFKRYNDEQGHVAGDAVLRAVAAAVVNTVRADDAVYRYGGEELLVVLDMQGERNAGRAAERILAGIRSLRLPHPGNEPHGVVTLSAGVAAASTELPTFNAVLAAADTALYEAKACGRNTFALASAVV